MLSPESLKKIDQEIAKYPADQKQSASMSALRIAQQEKGWLANETIEFVAKYLGMPTNLPCALSGGVHAAEYIKKKLGIDFNETTADGKFTLKEGECMGACGDAPVLLVNNHQMCSWMTEEKIDQLLADLQK